MLQQCIRWMPAVSCSSCWSVRCRQCSNRSPVAVGDVRNDGTAAEVSGAASAGQPKSAHLSRQKRANGRCVRLCSASPMANIYRRRMLAASVVNLDVHCGTRGEALTGSLSRWTADPGVHASTIMTPSGARLRGGGSRERGRHWPRLYPNPADTTCWPLRCTTKALTRGGHGSVECSR